MALDGNGLGAEIAQALEDLGVLNPNEGAADIEPIWQAISGAIVDHFKNNGEIIGQGAPTIPVQVVPASGTGSTTVPDAITGTIT